MTSLRTPDARFVSLPDFSFAPNFVDIDGPPGRGTADVLPRPGPVRCRARLTLHGEPTWCYLYRHMIPIFTAARANGCSAKGWSRIA